MKKVLLIATLMLSTQAAQAASDKSLNVATGIPTGTYAAMFKNLGTVCAKTAYLKEKGTSGSLENIELLLNNNVSLAFVQSDVLKARQQIDGDSRVSGIKTLLPLYNEEVHVFALPTTVKKNIIGKTTQVGVNSFQELDGKRIAAWGGSTITAKVLGAKLGVNYQVINVPDRETAFAALQKGQVEAVLAVVGQPAGWAKQLKGVKLLPVIYNAKLQGIYNEARLIYPNLSQNAVNSVSVQSILATRDFRTADKRDQLLKYQQCAIARLTQLRENEGMHSKWQDVTFKSWPWPQYK